jgi:uncharacterized protein YlxW (UPF0749 family)
MTLEELEQFVRVHHSAISQHQQWLSEQQQWKLEQQQWKLEQEERNRRLDRMFEANAAQQRQNAEAIANLTASIQDLRNVVADYTVLDTPKVLHC